MLFVCLGNICRSPAAKAVMRKILGNMGGHYKDILVDSAGIGSWHTGQLPDRRMRRTGERHGYDINSHARQVREIDFGRFNYIFGMDMENMSDLRSIAQGAVRHGIVPQESLAEILCAADFMNNHPNYSIIPDPYYGGEAGFELALELIEDACHGIINELLL